jgi:Holliday junction resolvase
MASKYNRGANAERRVKKYYEERGYFVVRSAGSHSPVDLVAVRDGRITFVQVKSGESPMPKRDVDKLIRLGAEYGVDYVAIVRVRRGKMEFEEYVPFAISCTPQHL